METILILMLFANQDPFDDQRDQRESPGEIPRDKLNTNWVSDFPPA